MNPEIQRDAAGQDSDKEPKSAFVRLLEAMRTAGLDVSVDGVLDAFWLAQRPGLSLFSGTGDSPLKIAESGKGNGTKNDVSHQLPKTTPAKEGAAGEAAAGDTADADAGKSNAGKTNQDPANTGGSGSDTGSLAGDSGGAYASPSGRDDRDTMPASLLRVPAGSALPGKLQLSRALRPLNKWFLNRNIEKLDEEETVEASARSGGAFIPVMRPERERWFECVVVADSGGSMDIWQDTLIEFEKMARTSGVFRDVRRLRLRWKARAETPAPDGVEKDGEKKDDDLTKDAELVGANGGAVNGTSLARLNARRLILLVTNGSGAHWNDGRMAALLQRWSKLCSVAIVQMLPEQMWNRTQAGEPSLLLRGLAAGTVTGQLDAQSKSWDSWDDDDATPLRRVPGAIPMWPLDAAWMDRWARMQMGGGQWVPGIVVTQRKASKRAAPPVERTPEQWKEAVTSFVMHATPEAYRLAAYLSKGPFTLPVARLVQDAKFGEKASHTQLAEILLSGLVQRLTKADDPLAAEWVQYQFHPVPAEFLQSSLRAEDALDIVRAVERRVQERWGHPLDLRALQYDPTGDQSIPKWAHPFVRLGAGLLGYRPAPVVPQDQPAVFISWTKPEWQPQGELLAEAFRDKGWHVLLSGRDAVPRKGVFVVLREELAPLIILDQDDLNARMNGLVELNVLPQRSRDPEVDFSSSSSAASSPWLRLDHDTIISAAALENSRPPMSAVHGAPPLELEAGISEESLGMHNILADFGHLIVYSNEQFDGRRACADLAWSSIRSRFEGGVYWVKPGASIPEAEGMLLIFEQPQEPVRIPDKCSFLMLDPVLDAIPQLEQYQVYEGLPERLAITQERSLTSLHRAGLPDEFVAPWAHHGDSPHLVRIWARLLEGDLGRDLLGRLMERLANVKSVGDVVQTERFLSRTAAESLPPPFRQCARLLTALGVQPPQWLLRRLNFNIAEAELLVPLGLARTSSEGLVGTQLLFEVYRNSPEASGWHTQIVDAMRGNGNPDWVLLASSEIYVRHNLIRHLDGAYRTDKVIDLLQDFRWWELRYRLDGATALEADLRLPQGLEAVDVMRTFWQMNRDSPDAPQSSEQWAERMQRHPEALLEPLRKSAAKHIEGLHAKASIPAPEHFIFVAGSRPVSADTIRDEPAWMAQAVGRALVECGWGLICGTQRGVDEIVFTAFQGALGEARPPLPIQGRARVITFEPFLRFPVAAGIDLTIVDNPLRIALEQADAVVLLGGAAWVEQIYDETIKQNKPVILVPGTGDAAERLFKQTEGSAETRSADLARKLGSPEDAALVAKAAMLAIEQMLNRGSGATPAASVLQVSISAELRKQWVDYLDASSDYKQLFDYRRKTPQFSGEEVLALVGSADVVEQMIGFNAFLVEPEKFSRPLFTKVEFNHQVARVALTTLRHFFAGQPTAIGFLRSPTSLTEAYMAFGVLNNLFLEGFGLPDELAGETLESLFPLLTPTLRMLGTTTRAVGVQRRVDRLKVQMELETEAKSLANLGDIVANGRSERRDEFWAAAKKLGEQEPPYQNPELKTCLRSPARTRRLFAYCSLMANPKAVFVDPLMECLESVEITDLGRYFGILVALEVFRAVASSRAMEHLNRLQELWTLVPVTLKTSFDAPLYIPSVASRQGSDPVAQTKGSKVAVKAPARPQKGAAPPKSKAKPKVKTRPTPKKK